MYEKRALARHSGAIAETHQQAVREGGRVGGTPLDLRHVLQVALADQRLDIGAPQQVLALAVSERVDSSKGTVKALTH